MIQSVGWYSTLGQITELVPAVAAKYQTLSRATWWRPSRCRWMRVTGRESGPPTWTVDAPECHSSRPQFCSQWPHSALGNHLSAVQNNNKLVVTYTHGPESKNIHNHLNKKTASTVIKVKKKRTMYIQHSPGQCVSRQSPGRGERRSVCWLEASVSTAAEATARPVQGSWRWWSWGPETQHQPR